ncbi:MAG: nitroreductase family deazaflavin-dependent oxidoreductase [Kineosporiaceae bacterium]
MNDWNRQIIDEFRANEGRVGGRFHGAPMILIHHVGARTGTERVNPLVYLPDGNRMIIAASNAGRVKDPDWYANVMTHPRLTVEVGTETFAVDATELLGQERDEVWQRLVEAMPGFGEYQRGLDRRIPLLALTRVT